MKGYNDPPNTMTEARRAYALRCADKALGLLQKPGDGLVPEKAVNLIELVVDLLDTNSMDSQDEEEVTR